MRIPYYVPSFPGIRFGDLARGLVELYATGMAERFVSDVLLQFSKYEEIPLRAVGSYGVQGRCFIPRGEGPAVVLIQGARVWRHAYSLPIANQLDRLLPGDVYTPIASATHQFAQSVVANVAKTARATGLILCGHSLGGGVATVLGNLLAGETLTRPFKVVTIGAPRVYRASVVSDRGGPWLWRFANHGDGVTALPNNVTEFAASNLVLPGILIPGTPDYRQTADGVRLYDDRAQFNIRETFATDGEAREAVIGWVTGLGTTAVSEHNPATYARRMDNASLELVPDVVARDPAMILPFDLGEADRARRTTGAIIGGSAIRGGVSDTPSGMMLPFDISDVIRSRERAADRGGPAAWAMSVPRVGTTRGVGALVGALDAMPVTIPKTARWSYSRVSGQHWATWMGRVLVQCNTKAAATLYCRRANQALRRLQKMVACDIDGYPQSWVDYLALATTPGSGFSPVLTVAS